jgi:hypothetical protein
VPVHGVQFSTMLDEQQFFLDAQSILPYFHPEQINQPEVHQHYQYLPQLHCQRFEAQHAIKAHRYLIDRPMNQSPRQLYFELPISHQIDKSKQKPFWNHYTNYRSSNQSNASDSFADFNAMQVLDKETKQKFPKTFYYVDEIAGSVYLIAKD